MGNKCWGRRQGGRGSLLDTTSPLLPDDDLTRSYRTILSSNPVTLSHSKCAINWHHGDRIVGLTNVVEINLVCCHGQPYVKRNRDYFQPNVTNNQTGEEVNCIIERRSSSTIRVSFTIHLSGMYTITFMMNQQIIGRVFRQEYQPGPPDANKTTFHLHTNNIVIKSDTMFPILFSPKDCYGNSALVHTDLFTFEVRKNNSDEEVELVYFVNPVEGDEDGRYELLIKLSRPGYYRCCFNYSNNNIGMNNTTIVCLDEVDYATMEANLKCTFLTHSHDVRIVPTDNTRKTRTARLYISPRLIQIRESSWMILSSRVYSCRVCNKTQFLFGSEPEVFVIDDGHQQPITLRSPKRETIAAVFFKFVQRNIGGTETFDSKMRSFHQEIRRRNPDDMRCNIHITVRRFELLESAMLATRRFTPEMWKRRFMVKFEGEDGIDLGGVTREFIECICDVLFGCRNPNGLFTRFSDDPQSLVHPNKKTKRDKSLTCDHYQFAGRIVGKCLYDTAMGERLLVKAKFTRSFLAQIIGLRVTWKHFETDDPEVYRCRVNYIRNSDVTELEELSLKFVDEEYSSSGSHDPRLVSLQPGGSKLHVTNSNKMDYLTKLAQHRLGKKVSDEIKSFIKGLNELIPEDLLTMFDENELELLMCGIQKLDYEDLRLNTQIRGGPDGFDRIVEWFWITVKQFNQEEMSRLVQFVTGSSQIPIGGFRELRPPFLVTYSGEQGNRLPYAHTCFNHLCLPIYDTYEQLRNGLMTAINEGCEGVLIA